MKRSLLSLSSFALLVTAALTGCAGERVQRPDSAAQVATTAGRIQDHKTPDFQWPLPAGWRSERMPFPLEFAPELPYHGIEELRFAPKFLDVSSPTYFSYSFVWLLEGAPAPFPPEQLARDLDAYFTGLARAVSREAVGRGTSKASKSDPGVAAPHDAHVERREDGTFQGLVHTVDAFNGSRPLTLTMVGEPIACGSHRGLLISFSPRSAESARGSDNEAIWSTLTAQRRTFKCSG